MANTFTLRATLTDGFTFDLEGCYFSQEAANRAAARFMRDYSDPCGLGNQVAYVATINKGAAR